MSALWDETLTAPPTAPYKDAVRQGMSPRREPADAVRPLSPPAVWPLWSRAPNPADGCRGPRDWPAPAGPLHRPLGPARPASGPRGQRGQAGRGGYRPVLRGGAVPGQA